MCGRYASSASPDQLVEIFEVDEVPDLPDVAALTPRWNIAPTDPVPAIVERADRDSGRVTRKLYAPRWGLVPSWSKQPGSGARMINARAETVAEKPSFRRAFAQRRCLIPADGYYEWYPLTEPDGTPVTAKGRPVKQPFWIHPFHREGEPDIMAMAGIYEFWRDESKPAGDPGAWLTTCSIITTEATDSLGMIHDRMPMQVRQADWDRWLDPHLTDPAAAHRLLHAPRADEMGAYAVSTRVNTVANDGPDLVLPLDEAPLVDPRKGSQ